MIRSMTGYGSAAAETPSLRAAVSVRSVNHRFLDLALHLPRRLHPLEAQVKRAVQARVQRGRVELSLQATLVGDGAGTVQAVDGLIGPLVEAARQVRGRHGLSGDVLVSDVLRFPGAFEVVEPPAAVAETLGAALLDLVGQALDGLDAMRRAEGEHLRRELLALLEGVSGAAARVEAGLEAAKALRREQLAERAKELVGELALDEGRLYQELARLVERHDVAEELQRLRSHVAQARDLLAGGGGPCGKRLDFLAQEMAREANTLGSKVPGAEGVREAVALKAEVERLREQVQNVE